LAFSQIHVLRAKFKFDLTPIGLVCKEIDKLSILCIYRLSACSFDEIFFLLSMGDDLHQQKWDWDQKFIWLAKSSVCENISS
jgi:hypothetical protein